MSADLLVFLASVSVTVAAVAVAVAICSWAETPGRVIPGRFVGSDGRSMDKESPLPPEAPLRNPGSGRAVTDLRGVSPRPQAPSSIERPSLLADTFE